MTGYVKPGTSPVVGFMTDYVDSGLTAFTKTLVTTYCTRFSVSIRRHFRTHSLLVTNTGITESKCGYACSDHASWTVSDLLIEFLELISFQSAGYSSVMPFESTFG
jgi:leucyl aminopeptidase